MRKSPETLPAASNGLAHASFPGWRHMASVPHPFDRGSMAGCCAMYRLTTRVLPLHGFHRLLPGLTHFLLGMPFAIQTDNAGLRLFRQCLKASCQSVQLCHFIRKMPGFVTPCIHVQVRDLHVHCCAHCGTAEHVERLTTRKTVQPRHGSTLRRLAGCCSVPHLDECLLQGVFRKLPVLQDAHLYPEKTRRNQAIQFRQRDPIGVCDVGQQLIEVTLQSGQLSVDAASVGGMLLSVSTIQGRFSHFVTV